MLKKSIAVFMLTTASFQPALADKSNTIFTYKGKDYTLGDLQPNLQQTYYTAEVKARESLLPIIEQAAVGQYIEELAEKSDRTINDIRAELLHAKPVSSEEVKAVYEQHKHQISRPFEEIEAALTEQLNQQNAREKYFALIERIIKETGFTITLPEPEAPVFDMNLSPYPFKGSADSDIIVVEFADYNCGACRRSKPEINKVLEEYSNQVKFYYIDYPVTERGVAGSTTQTARGAYCAGKQDKFWEFNHLAYQQPVTMGTATELAKTLKLDQKAFDICLTSSESKQFVVNSTQMAHQLGVSGTPTLFVNGQLMHTHDAGRDLRIELEKRLSQQD